MYIYIYIYLSEAAGDGKPADSRRRSYKHRLRTNGFNTNGAAANVMNFDRLGKKVRPGTFGNIQIG